jgi:putative SOS response-associated peptidase YedK
MCGRFSLTSTPEALAERFGLEAAPQWAPRYNVAPGQDVLAIRAGDGGARRAAPLRWGLVPPWSDPAEASRATLINARSETAAEKRAFRDAFHARRCIVPADGFYEWADLGGFRQPYWIAPPDAQPFGIAAIWERWRSPAGGALDTCALLTTAANARIARLHDRMPAILAPADYAHWLDPGSDPASLAPLLAPLADDALAFHPVSTRVNRIECDDPELLEPVPEPLRQPSLF